jgi:hypothetical protein
MVDGVLFGYIGTDSDLLKKPEALACFRLNQVALMVMSNSQASYVYKTQENISSNVSISPTVAAL